MSLPRLLLSVVILGLYVGCSTTKSTNQKNVFTFQINDTTYQITSLNTSTGEGLNILEQEDTELTARDVNQDGQLDVVVKGTKSLEQANWIYRTGIQIAQNSGNYQERSPLRRFEWENEDYIYAVSSYVFDEGRVSNIFAIGEKASYTEYIITDIEGDGILDNVDKGTITLEEAQIHYNMVLSEGIKFRHIELRNGIYVVLESQLSAAPPSS